MSIYWEDEAAHFEATGSLLGPEEAKRFGCICYKGLLDAAWVFERSNKCTCGAGPYDELTLHALDCDSVPCPMCPEEGVNATAEF